MTTPTAPELRNIQAIIGLERDVRERRSVLDRVTDVVSSVATEMCAWSRGGYVNARMVSARLRSAAGSEASMSSFTPS